MGRPLLLLTAAALAPSPWSASSGCGPSFFSRLQSSLLTRSSSSRLRPLLLLTAAALASPAWPAFSRLRPLLPLVAAALPLSLGVPPHGIPMGVLSPPDCTLPLRRQWHLPRRAHRLWARPMQQLLGPTRRRCVSGPLACTLVVMPPVVPFPPAPSGLTSSGVLFRHHRLQRGQSFVSLVDVTAEAELQKLPPTHIQDACAKYATTRGDLPHQDISLTTVLASLLGLPPHGCGPCFFSRLQPLPHQLGLPSHAAALASSCGCSPCFFCSGCLLTT